MKQDNVVELSTIDIVNIAHQYFGKKLTPVEASIIYEKLDESSDIDTALEYAVKETDTAKRMKVAYDFLISKIKQYNLL